MTKQRREYSAEWIDLLSPDTYSSSSSSSSPTTTTTTTATTTTTTTTTTLPGRMYPPRSGGVSFAATPDNSRLFAFGGYAEVMAADGAIPGSSSKMPKRYVVNDMWQFLPPPPHTITSDESSEEEEWGWTKLDNDGGGYVPPSRLATALAVLPNNDDNNDDDEASGGGGGRAVLLGGWDPQTPGTGGIILDDVSILDMNSMEWHRCVDDAPEEDGIGYGDGDGDADGDGDDDDDAFLAIPGGPTSRHVAVHLSIPRATTTGSGGDGDDDDDDDDEAGGGGGGGGGAREDVVCLHNHRCDNHVLVLSTTTTTTSTTTTIGGDRGDPPSSSPRFARWDVRATTGDAPPSLGLHCAASMRSSTAMVVFGGAAKDGKMSNGAYVLDATSWTWTKLDTSAATTTTTTTTTGDDDDGDGNENANIPAPRAGACLCPLDDDSVLMFGGATPGEGGGLVGLNDVWVLTVDDLESGKGVWRCLISHRDIDDDDDADDGGTTLPCPPGRNAATLNAIDVSKLLPNGILRKKSESHPADEDCKYYLLSGGWYPFRKTYNDIFLLRISSRVKQNPDLGDTNCVT